MAPIKQVVLKINTAGGINATWQAEVEVDNTTYRGVGADPTFAAVDLAERLSIKLRNTLEGRE